MVNVDKSELPDSTQTQESAGPTCGRVSRHVLGRSHHSIPGRLLYRHMWRTLCEHVHPPNRLVVPVPTCTTFSDYFPTGLRMRSNPPGLSGNRRFMAYSWHD